MAIRDLTARIRITADVKGVDRGLKQASKSVTTFKNDTAAAGIAIAASLVAISKGFDAAQAGADRLAQQQALGQNLQSLGLDLDDFLQRLQNVASGTVSAAELINSAGNALLLGIPAERIADLLEIARVSAVATGASVSQAFSDIALGVARQSRQILDNLGIIVDVESANAAYARQLGIVASELDDVQRKQAFLNAVLLEGEDRVAKFGAALDSNALGFQRFGAGVDDLTDSFGELLGSSDLLSDTLGVIGTVLQGDADAIRDLLDTTVKVNRETESYKKNLDTLIKSGLTAEEATERLDRSLRRSTKALQDTAPAAKDAAEAIDEEAESAEEASEATSVLARALGIAEGEFGDVETAARRTRQELARTAEQAIITAAAFDLIERTEGRAAAEAAAIAGGGLLVLGGTRINLPGGGSRLIRTNTGVAPSGGAFGDPSTSRILGQPLGRPLL